MRSIRWGAAMAAAILVTGLGPAMPAAASTAPQWQKTFPAAGYSVSGKATAVSPDGSTVFVTGTAANATAGADTGFGKTIAYNAATGALIWTATFNPHPGVDDNGFSSIAVTPNGSTVFVTGRSGDANQGLGLVEATVAYNAATGAELWQVIGTTHDSNGVHPLAVSPDSSKVFVTSAGGSTAGQTSAYNAATGARLWTTQAGGDAIALSAKGSALYVTGEPIGSVYGPTTEAFNTATGATIWQATESGDALTAAALSPDGSVLFVSGSSKNFTRSATVAYSASSGARLWTVTTGGYGSTVEGVAVTPDGSKVIVSEYTNAPPPSQVTYWTTLALKPATGATLWKKTTHFTGVGPVASAFALSPDGSTAYVTGYSYNFNTAPSSGVWVTIGYSTTDGTQVFSARYHDLSNNFAYAIAVSPNSSQVFVTGTTNSGSGGGAGDDIMVTVAYRTS